MRDSRLSRLKSILPSGIVLAAALVGVAVRLLIVLRFPEMPLFGDEQVYLRGAEQLLAGQDVTCIPFRPPLYIFFQAAVLGLVAHSTAAICVVQSLLGGLTILGVAAIAKRAADGRAAAVAAWLTALYPEFVSYSHYLFSETVFLFLLVCGLLAAQSLFRFPTLGRALLVGFLFGVLTLIRSFHLYLLPLLLLAFLYSGGREEWRRRFTLGLGSLLLAVFVTVPWSVYVSLKRGTFINVCNTGSLAVKNGTNYYRPPHFDYPDSYTPPPQLRDKIGRKEGVVAFITENPGLFVSRAVEKMTWLWSPSSLLVRSIYFGKYGDPRRMEPWVRLSVVYLSCAATMALILLGMLGFAVAKDRFLFLASGLYTQPYVLMVIIALSHSRYRLPLMIFAILYSAIILTRFREVKRVLRRPWIAGSLLLLAGLFGALWWMRFEVVLPAVW